MTDTTMRTLGPAVTEFFETCLVLPSGLAERQPFVLEQWQREATDLIYEVDDNDMPKWQMVVLGIPRGNGKSPLCGGYADYDLANGTGSPQVFCTAAAREQAGVVHMHANAEARGGPLEDFFEFPRVTTALGPIKCPHNNGILRVLSADGDLQQGLIPYRVYEDEPHAFTTGKQIGLHFAMTTALHKRPDSRMVLITTAGASKQSLLGELVDAIIACGEVEYRNNRCLLIARDYNAKRLLIWYGAPDDADVSDPAVWRACNPASWITDEALRIAAASNPESEFRRYYLNQWVRGADAAIQPAAWDACMQPGIIRPGSEIWVGIDIGEKRDTSSVGFVRPCPSGRLRAQATVFDPGIEERASLLPLVEAELRRLMDTFIVRQINYDAWQMRDLANRLASEGMPMVEFPQNNTHMVPASQLVFDLVNARTIVHDGDITLRKHVLATASEATARGGWRFVKPKTRTGNKDQTQKIDAAIALTMACAAWADENTGGDLWVL